MAQATYAQLATLRNSSVFQDRVTMAVTFYARFILGVSAKMGFNKVAWARNAYQNPTSVAQGLLSAVALDSVIADETVLDKATDEQIQAATEAVIAQAIDF